MSLKTLDATNEVILHKHYIAIKSLISERNRLDAEILAVANQINDNPAFAEIASPEEKILIETKIEVLK